MVVATTNFDLLMEEGKSLFQREQYEEALASYSKALGGAPKAKRHLVLSNLAGCLLKLGHFNEAMIVGHACIEADPTFLKGYHRLAVACSKSGQLDQAKAAVEKMMDIWTERGDFHENDIRFELELYCEFVVGDIPSLSAEEAESLLKATRLYANSFQKKGPASPVSYVAAIRHTPRYVAALRTSGYFASPTKLHQKLKVFLDEFLAGEATKRTQGAKTSGETYRSSSEWSVLWSDSPPTRAELESSTGLKWPSIEDFWRMQPHVITGPVTFEDVQAWYGPLVADCPRDSLIPLLSQHTSTLVDSDNAVLSCVRIYLGRSPAWGEWYQMHKERYHRAFLEWGKVCAANNIYDVYTKEFVDAFAAFLASRVPTADEAMEKFTILEAGAGDGRLFRYVKDAFGRIARSGHPNLRKVTFLACDNTPSPSAEVIYRSYRAVLRDAKPQLVYCSWMPQGQDWTKDFRATPSVGEYIHVGPHDTGSTGDAWLTWGVKRAKKKLTAQISPYAKDGWTRHDLDHLSQHLISKDDRSNEYFASAVISFRRNQ